MLSKHNIATNTIPVDPQNFKVVLDMFMEPNIVTNTSSVDIQPLKAVLNMF